MNKPTLYMLFGYPGAGKTTTAKMLAELTGAKLLSSDAVRLELFPQPRFSQTEHDTLYRTLDERTEQLLAAGQSVIYDANLNRRQHRQDKYDICRRTGAASVLLWIQTPKGVAKQRAMDESRSHLWPPDETPDAMFDRIAGVIEPPGKDEPYIELDGTAVTPEYVRSRLS